MTKIEIGKELKQKVNNKENIEEIGIWAYKVYLEYMDVNDLIFLRSFLVLGQMELGPEFFYTYDELNEIADDLIAGHVVDLNPD